MATEAWTLWQLQSLRRLHNAGLSIKAIAAGVRRRPAEVRQKAQEMGLWRLSGCDYFEDEIDVIRRGSEARWPRDEIAAQLGRTVRGIEQKAAQLGLKLAPVSRARKPAGTPKPAPWDKMKGTAKPGRAATAAKLESRCAPEPTAEPTTTASAALVDMVVHAVCAAAGISPVELLGRSQLPHNCWPRFVAFRVARDRSELTWSEIACLFNRTFHQSVMNGARRLAEEIEPREPALARLRTHAEAILDGRERGPCKIWTARAAELQTGYRAWREDKKAPAPEARPDEPQELTEKMAATLRVIIAHPGGDMAAQAKKAGKPLNAFSAQVTRLAKAGFVQRSSKGLRALKFPNGRAIPKPDARSDDLVAEYIAKKGVTLCPPAVLDSGQGYAGGGLGKSGIKAAAAP